MNKFTFLQRYLSRDKKSFLGLLIFNQYKRLFIQSQEPYLSISSITHRALNIAAYPVIELVSVNEYIERLSHIFFNSGVAQQQF